MRDHSVRAARIGLGFSAAVMLFASVLRGAEVTLSGRIVDENEVRVESARITVRPSVLLPNAPAGPWEARTDPTGAFSLRIPAPGDYLVGVTREGYYELKDRPLHVEGAAEVILTINTVREVFQSLNVEDRPSPVDVSQTLNEEHLSGTEVTDTPYPNSHDLRQSIQLIPGVVADPAGALHFNGSSENQVLYLLNGFNITDPISGQFHTSLAVESVRSLDFSSGRYSPEFGQGSAGAMAVSTTNGTDAFHYTATDFIPGLSVQHGARLSSWYPRVGFSGPLVPGKAWFSDTFYSAYNDALVPGLPSGQNTRRSWAGSNLLHAQVNLTPSNILFADFLVNVDNQDRLGLGPLDPASTTSDSRDREYFASLKDQIYLGRGALIEFGYGYNRFSDVQSPQGSQLYVFSPQGRTGNYFLDSRQTASRNQLLVNGYFPTFHFAGTHQIKTGLGADILSYSAVNHRTGYELVGLTGNLLSETLFEGPGTPRVFDTEMSAFLVDTWRVSKRFQFDLGARGDWDQRIQALAWSPRGAFSWAPSKSGRTRISAGYAVTRDAPPLELLGRPLDQTALTTAYNPDGTPVSAPMPTTFAIGHRALDLPRASNWTLGVDHQLSERTFLSAKYLRRRENDGFAFVNTLAPDAPPYDLPLPNGAAGGNYALTNFRRDTYDAFQVSARQSFSGQYEWMASYVRSRALSNTVLDYRASDPLEVLPGLVPMPWNAPNRVLGWAYLPLPWKNWAFSLLADARNGFPFSVTQPTGLIAGDVDSRRYPFDFDLNIALERMLFFRGYRFALRVGLNNVTNRANPTAVNNTIGSPQFLQLYGNEGRHAVIRIRFFGRSAAK